MRLLVAVVICVVPALPAGASASSHPDTLLRHASRLSGLPARHSVPRATVSPHRYESVVSRAYSRDYPSALRRLDGTLYAKLGLRTRNAKQTPSRAWYDPSTRKLLLWRKPSASRRNVVHELVRALIDQNFGLRRLVGLRTRDRDRALAARGIVEGTASLVSGARTTSLCGTAQDRFLQLEAQAGLGPGRALARELRYLGGQTALASALRTFPQTTEQLLHIDKFLERERALPITLPSLIGSAKLTSSETFGELDVRSLLHAFSVPSAGTIAAGWGGGRLALYTDGSNEVAALVLRWDSPGDALEWREGVATYVAAAFHGEHVGDCPPLDRCWAGDDELGAGVLGRTSVFASGPGAAAIAAALLTLK
jgi:hypothetical protein